jgi:hypothetical protein
VNIRSLRWPWSDGVGDVAPLHFKHRYIYLGSLDSFCSHGAGRSHTVSHLGVTIATIDRTALARIKRDSGDDRTLCALSPNLDLLPFSGYLCYFYGLESAILRFLALFAAFWGILQLLVPEECLLTRGPCERLGAVYALDRTIVKFIGGISRNWRGFADLLKI